MFCAEVKMSAFTKRKKQLSQAEVDTSRQLSRVHICVEGAIGGVRQKYTMLESTLPMNLIMFTLGDKVSTVDTIVFKCCALYKLL